MRISIFGLGYVGAVSLACLARDGHQVVGVDVSQDKLDLISSGCSPVIEAGIQELMQKAVASGRVEVTKDPTRAVLGTNLSFICVGTPSSPRGSQDLSAVLRVAEAIGCGLRDKDGFHTIVLRSTVEPGTVEEKFRPIVEQYSGKRAATDFALAFQPEFLREGTSIADYDKPPFTICGADSERGVAALRELFGHLPCEFIVTDIRTAEGMKMACNAFHAVKITFANEMGRVSQALGIDGRHLMALLCKDTNLNISPTYLRPGFAFGGSCLPKDLRALNYMSRACDVDTPMLSAVLASNQIHVQHVVERIRREPRATIGLIGLSFKADTDDLRESPLVELAERLIGKGYLLRIYDSHVNVARLIGANKAYIEAMVPHFEALLTDSIDQVLDCPIVVVGQLGDAVRAALNNRQYGDQLVIDLVGMKETAALPGRYWGVCW
jgi:GDP-mannose 6-dehydrogenase